jgi:HAMP domain-containing protein
VTDILNWWDGVELWLSGLSFLAQTVVVMPVVLVLAFAAAVVLDALLGNGIRVLRRIRHSDDEGLGDGR